MAGALHLQAAGGTPTPAYKVLEPIRQGSLMIFPVVAASTHDTSPFLTLDEGLSSGEVVITESDRRAYPLFRRRPGPGPIPGPIMGGPEPVESAEVNRLLLTNNSNRPLLLLAGEIVTGGKQDRVVGTDRIVPAQSEPVDLSVFCVEPGRWTGASSSFSGFAAQMAQPSIRNRAMAARDQTEVWNEVRSSNQAIGGAVAALGRNPTSYAGNMEAPEAREKVDQVADPISRSYEDLMRKLKQHGASGVVVAIHGRLEWADLFASEALLQKYWTKLVRSYAAESLTDGGGSVTAPGIAEAQQFLNAMQGEREVSQTESGVYRQTEVQGPGWKVFLLTSLLPGTGYDVHVAKMATGRTIQPLGMMRRRGE
jgi:hypothetical protein